MKKSAIKVKKNGKKGKIYHTLTIIKWTCEGSQKFCTSATRISEI